MSLSTPRPFRVHPWGGQHVARALTLSRSCASTFVNVHGRVHPVQPRHPTFVYTSGTEVVCSPSFYTPPLSSQRFTSNGGGQGGRRVEAALRRRVGRFRVHPGMDRGGGRAGHMGAPLAARWAESPRVTPCPPHNPSRAGDTGLSIRSLLARNRDWSTLAEFFSDGDVAARLHGFSGRLFGAHNHAAFGSENRGRLITGGGGPKNRPGSVWGTPPLTVCETTPHVTRGQEP